MDNYYSYDQSSARHGSISKVFGYMFLGLLITAATAFSIFYLILTNGISANGYLGLTIVASIALIILTIVTQIYCLKNKRGGLLTYGLYSGAMGVLLSSLMLTYNIRFLGFVFLCTAGTFGIMALYGYFTKTSTTSLGMFGVGALFGILTLTLVNIFIGSQTIYYIISYIGLAAMLALTAYDINRAKKISESGGMYNGMAIYMALQLYTDFIYIFLRLVILLSRNRD